MSARKVLAACVIATLWNLGTVVYGAYMLSAGSTFAGVLMLVLGVPSFFWTLYNTTRAVNFSERERATSQSTDLVESGAYRTATRPNGSVRIEPLPQPPVRFEHMEKSKAIIAHVTKLEGCPPGEYLAPSADSADSWTAWRYRKSLREVGRDIGCALAAEHERVQLAEELGYDVEELYALDAAAANKKGR